MDCLEAGFPSREKIGHFRKSLLAWFEKCGRRFPWRMKVSPFQILVAEVLLQQTDAHRVWEFYESFIRRFPTSMSLARATLPEIRRFIEPIGLLYRAERLKQIAVILTNKYDGVVPESYKALLEMPGIGPYAAAAIMCFAFGKVIPFQDVNFSRFYGRYFGLDLNMVRPQRDQRLFRLAQSVLPDQASASFNYAVLDFAALICTRNRPKCRCCVLRGTCSSTHNSPSTIKIGIDLFSGAGGLALGASSAGLVLAYGMEGDEKVAGTYEFNFPRTAVVKQFLKEGDAMSVCTSLGIAPGSIDIVMAGPPCQGFSISNLRTRNDANPSNHTWRIIIEFVKYLKPHGVIIENVCGMRSYRHGEVTGEIRTELVNQGYDCKILELNAVDFGVPQNRRRLFITAVDRGTLADLPDAIAKRYSKPVSVSMAIKDLPLAPNGNKVDGLPYKLFGSALVSYQKLMRKGAGKTVRNCLTSLNTDLIVQRFSLVPQGGNWENIPENLFTTYSNPENCHRWLYRRLSDKHPSVTISDFRKNMLIHPWLNRTLSVREAARLQGFHDRFIFHGNLRSQQQQVANAVPPQMAKAVIEIVLEILGGR
ncbi:MAG: DNA (cytosine-5-)-methyltransferase [Planctomycetota bacterium]